MEGFEIEYWSSLYLDLASAEKLRGGSRGPKRCLMNMINEALIFRDGQPFPEVAFELPALPTDIFFVYSHAGLSLSHFISGAPIDGLKRNASIKRLTALRGCQRTLSSPNSNLCWDFMIAFDVLLAEHLAVREEQADIPWVYELLSRALMNDERMDYILSRPSDFEMNSFEEMDWG